MALIGAGGLLPGQSLIRTKQAVVDGSKSFLAGVLLDPDIFADLPFDDFAADLTGGESDGG
ncbi:MAG: hypothetical protein IID40_05100 [Planctomycetes bacterium]|nr:hypothetical protein [Planctomycetota bacterium]